MVRLYDFELSGSCYKVRLLLNILRVSCERIPVDFVNKEHKGDRFLMLNPLGELPVMEDGDPPAARCAIDPGLYCPAV